MAKTKLQIEVNANLDLNQDIQIAIGKIHGIMTPPIDKEFWAVRIKVHEKQAVVAFPKFYTMGIGFQIEDDDWNTNLPYGCKTEEIYNHIKCNKGYKEIADEDCIKAIKMIKAFIKKHDLVKFFYPKD